MFTLETALSLLAFSAPITAGIVKLVPRRNGNHITVREYDTFKFELGDRLNKIEAKIDSLCALVKKHVT